MKSKIAKIFFLITVPLLLHVNVFAQKSTTCSNCAIISFDEIYASNLIDLHRPAYGYSYLIVSDTTSLDAMMFALSKKKYSSMKNILDTLRVHFSLYTIVKDSVENKSISTKLFNLNEYSSGYLFSLNDEIKLHSSVYGYIIKRYNHYGKIWHENFNVKLRQVTIKKLE